MAEINVEAMQKPRNESGLEISVEQLSEDVKRLHDALHEMRVKATHLTQPDITADSAEPWKEGDHEPWSPIRGRMEEIRREVRGMTEVVVDFTTRLD